MRNFSAISGTRTGFENQKNFCTISVHLHNDWSVDNEGRLGAAADLLFALKEVRTLVSGGENVSGSRFSHWTAFSRAMM